MTKFKVGMIVRTTGYTGESYWQGVIVRPYEWNALGPMREAWWIQLDSGLQYAVYASDLTPVEVGALPIENL